MTPGSETRSIEEKIRIAEYCTELVRNKDDILIEPGTTTFLAGKIMGGISDRSFRIITNSLELALETGQSPNIRTVILGGEIWKRHSLLVQAGHNYFANCHHHHTLLLSADGIHPLHGVSIFESRLIALIQEMISVSDRVVLAADSSKFGQVHFNKLADWDQFSLVVTDTNASDGDIAFLEGRGIEVVRV